MLLLFSIITACHEVIFSKLCPYQDFFSQHGQCSRVFCNLQEQLKHTSSKLSEQTTLCVVNCLLYRVDKQGIKQVNLFPIKRCFYVNHVFGVTHLLRYLSTLRAYTFSPTLVSVQGEGGCECTHPPSYLNF